MATWDEVADHFITKMMALFREPDDGDRKLVLDEYTAHLKQYDAAVLDRAWGDLKLRTSPWWPTLGEIDLACRKYLPSPHEPGVRRGRWWRREGVVVEDEVMPPGVLVQRIEEMLDGYSSDTPLGPTIRRILEGMLSECRARRGSAPRLITDQSAANEIPPL
jgi:hypothetical protein